MTQTQTNKNNTSTSSKPSRWVNHFLLHSRLKYGKQLVTPGVPVNLVEGLYLEYIVIAFQISEDRERVKMLLPDIERSKKGK